jgi:hypothetical protein
MSERGDIIDRASQLEELEREAHIKARQNLIKPISNGVCLNCEEITTPTTHFCDADCRNDFELRISAQRRNGNPARTHLEN